jgi:magnesium-transporting ATPase (P-type)
MGKDDEQTLTINLRHSDSLVYYRLLQTIEFTSDRKRMSVIVQEIIGKPADPQYGRIFLFIKGADNIMVQQLSKEYLDDIDKRNLLFETKR